jgi:hypothetical protein
MIAASRVFGPYPCSKKMAEKHVSEKDGERVNFAELNMDYNHAGKLAIRWHARLQASLLSNQAPVKSKF